VSCASRGIIADFLTLRDRLRRQSSRTRLRLLRQASSRNLGLRAT